MMTGREFKQARADIGRVWELGRPIAKGELARILNVSPQTIANYESGASPVPGPVSLCLWYMKRGNLPPGGRTARRLAP